jgi:hypothetical protein
MPSSPSAERFFIFLLFSVFRALRARKTENRKWKSTMLPQAKSSSARPLSKKGEAHANLRILLPHLPEADQRLLQQRRAGRDAGGRLRRLRRRESDAADLQCRRRSLGRGGYGARRRPGIVGRLRGEHPQALAQAMRAAGAGRDMGKDFQEVAGRLEKGESAASVEASLRKRVGEDMQAH